MYDYNKYWERKTSYGKLFFDRATGKKVEMESSKSLCEVIKSFYKPNMKILDVGCGAGHYLLSLQKRLDKNVDYTGVDITDPYIELAKQAFPQYPFHIGNINNLNFEDNSFDIVICNNVILHLSPPPRRAISELLRVSSKYVVIRTPVAKRNYIIKEVTDRDDDIDEKTLKSLPEKHSDLIKDDGEPVVWSYLNLYTEQFFKDVIQDNDCIVKIIDDTFWKDFKKEVDSKTVTEIIDDRQISGNIILDWKFLIIEKVV